MTAAQVAVAALVAVLIGASLALLLTDRPVSGWVFGGFGLLGFVLLVGAVASDRRT